MDRLISRISALWQSALSRDDPSLSNIKMLSIAAVFLLVTIGLIVMQPGIDPEMDQASAEAPQQPLSGTTSEVTRADASLLALEAPSASQAVSRQLRQPIRLTDTDANHSDLRALTANVLAGFGYTAGPGDRFHTLLVQALTEGQSNAYIDALLNTAAARGEFVPPRKLQMSSGRMDTNRLLAALVNKAQN
ncbi:hypothetical protein [uncultured Tateyamaria sp.]|uniref:hypothetical protein n=1 Tax=uncultured Tateyamaria sp. TaxID=455651 RepID=UPI002624545E|nr:hypothetical protein [uncultured Tateyamaria sp.]